MSYQPQQQAPRRKGGGGMFFMILLGIGAYLIFSNMGAGAPGENGAGLPEQQPVPRPAAEPIEDDYANQREAVFGPDKTSTQSSVGQPMPSTGGTGAAKDWNMEDVATQQNPLAPAATPTLDPRSSKTQKGDWAIEEIETKKRSASGLEFSTETTTPKATPGGDWAIEDVKPKTNAKTQKGDWAIEETN